MPQTLHVSNLRLAGKGIVTRSSRMRGLNMTMNPRMPPQSDLAAKVGVLLYDTTVEVDAILTDTVQRVRARGIAVGGLLQRLGERLSNGKQSMWLDDIATGRTIRIDQPRGPGARACILDTDALAQAALLLRRATEAENALIVVNRFGHAEANGGGMRTEIADALCSGAAVLIAVRPTGWMAWKASLADRHRCSRPLPRRSPTGPNMRWRSRGKLPPGTDDHAAGGYPKPDHSITVAQASI
jgi:hypothetical protein